MDLEITAQHMIIAASLLGGGAAGSIITMVVASYRGSVQPVARRVEISPLFASGVAGTTFKTNITVSDGKADHHFPNLHVAEIEMINVGNKDLPAFSFGATLSPMDKAVHVELRSADRHHVATLKAACSPASPATELDFELRPFNRGDAYALKAFIVAGGMEPGAIRLSTSEAVRFTDTPSLADAIANTVVKVGPIVIRSIT